MTKNKENKTFKIRLWIKDKKSEEIIELSKTENLEVEWKESWGKVKKEVIFKKNNKDYRILVRVLLSKRLLGMRNVMEKKNFLLPPMSLMKFMEDIWENPTIVLKRIEKDKKLQCLQTNEIEVEYAHFWQ